MQLPEIPFISSSSYIIIVSIYIYIYFNFIIKSDWNKSVCSEYYIIISAMIITSSRGLSGRICILVCKCDHNYSVPVIKITMMGHRLYWWWYLQLRTKSMKSLRFVFYLFFFVCRLFKIGSVFILFFNLERKEKWRKITYL